MMHCSMQNRKLDLFYLGVVLKGCGMGSDVSRVLAGIWRLRARDAFMIYIVSKRIVAPKLKTFSTRM
jgi:hypothetical protein